MKELLYALVVGAFVYGQDLETLKSADGWYATMTAFDSTDDLLVGYMTN